jgi:hypothetical protein
MVCGGIVTGAMIIATFAVFEKGGPKSCRLWTRLKGEGEGLSRHAEATPAGGTCRSCQCRFNLLVHGLTRLMPKTVGHERGNRETCPYQVVTG